MNVLSIRARSVGIAEEFVPYTYSGPSRNAPICDRIKRRLQHSWDAHRLVSAPLFEANVRSGEVNTASSSLSPRSCNRAIGRGSRSRQRSTALTLLGIEHPHMMAPRWHRMKRFSSMFPVPGSKFWFMVLFGVLCSWFRLRRSLMLAGATTERQNPEPRPANHEPRTEPRTRTWNVERGTRNYRHRRYCALAVLVSVLVGANCSERPSVNGRRVIVLGFDGLDYDLTRK